MANEPKPKCTICQKSIRTYRSWHDWESRESHYKCWKEQRERQRLNEWMQEMLKNPDTM